MTEGTTKSGFKFSISESKIESVEYFKICRAITRGDPFAALDGYEFLLGEEQFNALCDHLRKEDGTASMNDVEKEVSEMVDAAQVTRKAAKNSGTSPA